MNYFKISGCIVFLVCLWASYHQDILVKETLTCEEKARIKDWQKSKIYTLLLPVAIVFALSIVGIVILEDSVKFSKNYLEPSLTGFVVFVNLCTIFFEYKQLKQLDLSVSYTNNQIKSQVIFSIGLCVWMLSSFF
ncbi:MAG: hypothetical protein ACRC2R_03495 [Xenococcaceae cyanobacterium]